MGLMDVICGILIIFGLEPATGKPISSSVSRFRRQSHTSVMGLHPSSRQFHCALELADLEHRSYRLCELSMA